MRIRSMKQATEILSEYVPGPRAFRSAYTLDRMHELMAALGNPQNTYKVIHVAGTSGKTSTSYYVAALLTAAGKKTGLTVSPHIDSLSERVQINLEPLDDSTFCARLGEFMDLVANTSLKPTYFEIMVAFAYWYFAKAEVDYAVIEVGLGGLLDGTNVIDRPDKISVITDIGLDHTNVLGDSLQAIATQKAGIIQPHGTVFAYEQEEVVMDVLRETTDQLHAELHELKPLRPGELPSNLPLYQRRNWYLALSVYEFLRKRDRLPRLDEGQLHHSTDVYIPGRMEIIDYKDKQIVLDGAHNSQKMQALTGSLKHRFKNQQVAVLFSLLQSKKSRTVSTLREITRIANHLIITSYDTEQDLRKVSVDPLKVGEYCEELDFHEWEIVDDPKAAVGALLARPEPVLLITGSFYLLSTIRKQLRGITND